MLQILVVLGAGGLLSLKCLDHRTLLLNLYGSQPVEEHDRGRNERSTPRSFVLPATPGVAAAQEAMNDTGVRKRQVLRCVSVLRTLGYQIDGDESLLNARVVEAIYTFQEDRHLPATGKVDDATMRALKCS
jgi:hypothetical protein